MELVRQVLGAALIVAAGYLAIRGFVRVMRNTGELRNHLYQAKSCSGAAVVLAFGIGLLLESWAGVFMVPALLALIWLQYWVARVTIRKMIASGRPDD